MVECQDKHCFQHGSIKTRGHVSEGEVVSDKGKRTVVVAKDFLRRIPKYKRYGRERSRILAHNPDCISAKKGDIVKIAECRKISKTKAWTVVEVIGKAEKKGEKK